jgi:hypothetical protein
MPPTSPNPLRHPFRPQPRETSLSSVRDVHTMEFEYETRAMIREHLSACEVYHKGVDADLKFLKALLYRVAWGVLGGLVLTVVSLVAPMLGIHLQH